MEKGDFKLTRAERLFKSADFRRVFKEGKRFVFPEFTLIVVRNGMALSRMGTSVGKKFGKATERNRAKRLCRELFRLNKHGFPRGIDLVFLPKRRILFEKWENLQKRMTKAGEKIQRHIYQC